MTKLTFSKARKIFIILFALVMTGGMGMGFFYFLLTEPHSVVTWAIMLPLFVIFAAASILGVRQAFSAYCSFDDEDGIEFYGGLAGRAKIPVSALTGFFPMNNGIDIHYKKNIKGEEKNKSIRVSTDFQHLQSLNEWLSGRTKNLYAEQVEASVQEFKSEHSELSDEEKAAFFRKTHRIARVLKWVGAAVAVLFFLSMTKGEVIEQVAFAVCAAYPVLMLLLLRFSNGAFHFDGRNTDVHPSLLAPFVYCEVALCFSGGAYAELTCGLSKLIGVSAVAALCMFALYHICASDAEKSIPEKRLVKWLRPVGSLILFFIYGFGVTGTANVLFDSSEPVVYEATVLNQRVSNGRHTDYYLEVSSVD